MDAIPIVAEGPARVEWPDQLRGAAALGIVLFHSRVNLWVGLRALMQDPHAWWFDRVSGWITAPFPLFGSAVMLFFVVSGFAIHYPYAHPRAKFEIRPYLTKRFFRIYPPYFAAVLLSVLAGRIITHDSVPSWTKVGETALMMQNYVPPRGQLSANLSLWSLPVEVELYLVYPLLLWWWRRAGSGRMLAGVGVISGLAALAVFGGQGWLVGNFAKYWIIWVVGAVLADRLRAGTLPAWRTRHAFLACGALALVLVCRVAGLQDSFEQFAWGAFYVLLTWWGLTAAPSRLRVPRIIRPRFLWLGKVSYSLYLVHFPFFLVVGAVWVAWRGQKPSTVIVPLVMSAAAVAVSYVFWRWIERPSQLLGRALAAPSPAVVSTSHPVLG